MSNEEASISSNPLITKWVGELGDTFCFTNPENAFCKTCGITVSFTAANIPLHKLQNPVLKTFLAKYTNRHIPDDDSILRKNYIPGCYKKIMTSIQNKVAVNYSPTETLMEFDFGCKFTFVT
jgi:hypothetical protein